MDIPTVHILAPAVSRTKRFKGDNAIKLIIIAVEDNGVGITEEALGKIFIPFFTTNKQGSGIGLSLSHQILRKHNATISARSVPNKGTVLTLRFR